MKYFFDDKEFVIISKTIYFDLLIEINKSPRNISHNESLVE